MSAIKKITKGQRVTFKCSSSLADGTSLDAPEDNEPMTMTAGVETENNFANAISKALVGMAAGKSRKVTLKPKDAFGDINKNKIVKVPLDQLPEGIMKGDTVTLETEEGEDEAQIVSISAKTATLDFNHPLASESVVLEIEVIKLSK